MRVYPQAISGKYRRLRNYGSYLLLLVYFGCSWIRWPRGNGLPSQAFLMDLPNRRAYIFGLEIWPEEIYYLTGMLILGAMGLFFVTSLFGRIWCGYGCPHTVFVDLFLKVELYFQGDRNARIKLDREPWHREKFIKKISTFAAWFVIAFSFAFGWVCYFYDAPTLAHDIMRFKVSSGGLNWLAGLTVSTYIFAGYVREKVCTYMCPYGRFQSAMLDNDSSLVTYHGWRGEPRGKPGAGVQSKGDCIDCGKCVVVCPMDIDIRQGLQMQCIGCGLCVDACNSVMEKLGRPLHLIAYDSVNSMTAKMKGLPLAKRALQIKTTLFAGIFAIVAGLLLYALANKPDLTVSILRDRGALYTVLPDGSYRNTYVLKIFNRTLKPRKISLTVSGLAFKLSNQNEYIDKYEISMLPEEEIELEVYIKIGFNNVAGTNSVTINLYDESNRKIKEINSPFMK